MRSKHQEKSLNCTYDGTSGAGSACPVGRPCGSGGAPPPGRFGMAGAERDTAPGAGGGPRLPPPLPIEDNEPWKNVYFDLFIHLLIARKFFIDIQLNHCNIIYLFNLNS